MSGKKISELPILSVPTLSGVTAIVESGVTYQATLSSLQSLLVNTEISVTGGSFDGNTVYINNSDGSIISISISALTSAGIYLDGTLYLRNNTSDLFTITGLSNPFIYNQTRTGVTNTVKSNESLFNHSDLVVQTGTIFIVEPSGEYYVLGDLYNNGTILVDGTLKIGGTLYNSGIIIGSGTII